jgi:hypothetical protein
MTTDEIHAAAERFLARVTAILTPDELAAYRRYRRRLEQKIAERDPQALVIAPLEQAVLAKIEADTEAAALRKQYSVLIGLEKLPQ